MNGQIGVRNDRWEAYLWAKNMFDEEYRTVIFNSVLFTGGPNSLNAFTGAPRMWGVTVGAYF